MRAAERIREFRHAFEAAFPERRVPSPSGTGLFVDSLPNVYDLNYLAAERAASAETLAAEADALMERFAHRKVVSADGSVADGFLALRWHVATHLVMAVQREPDRRVDTSAVREVRFEEIAGARAWEVDDAGLRESLNNAKRLIGRAVPTRWLGVFADGRLAGYCELSSSRGVAQIEDVNMLPQQQGRGLGRALVQSARDEALRTHGVVFLEALEHDWPRELYAKLGFDVVDARHHFLLPPGPDAHRDV
jgi:GNAT superfamily N-acetyltransferase